MDRFFFDSACPAKAIRDFTLHTVTAFLIASKYDELDDHIPQIKEIQRYVARMERSPRSPSFYEIVECEREIGRFFDWNFGFLVPQHFIDSFLANGVAF